MGPHENIDEEAADADDESQPIRTTMIRKTRTALAQIHHSAKRLQ